jgi:hypothetical protein
MGGRMHARDRRHVAFYRSGLLAGLHAILDERADRLWSCRQAGLTARFAVGLEDRAVRLLGTQRIGRVRALRHRLPLKQGSERTCRFVLKMRFCMLHGATKSDGCG